MWMSGAGFGRRPATAEQKVRCTGYKMINRSKVQVEAYALLLFLLLMQETCMFLHNENTD
ncbi:hypothetical protein GCM10010911_38980 [Paenibacillus nasutitermitis]|uniref:Uncharacterized protein n=1 Tax=Paenibacillus nasutitermitis TaxID=1652958 RepID=A0A916Z670_9BACL|nr:hypothetical protein GCM10010911_38980 [Paenibacillus nasutitermitis]